MGSGQHGSADATAELGRLWLLSILTGGGDPEPLHDRVSAGCVIHVDGACIDFEKARHSLQLLVPRCDDVAVIRSTEEQLLLGEWACLGILYPAPTHGFAIAARLKPGGDVGRVWSLSRPLTYRSLDQLTSRGYVHAVGEEPGIAGGNRTILAATRSGRAQLRKWLTTPVAHLRDLRSELLLKLIIAELCEIDVTKMLDEQYQHIDQLAKALGGQIDDDVSVDVVALWRRELSQAALRFLDQLPGRDTRSRGRKVSR